MALSITVNGGGTFTASMEEGPVSFTASLGAVGPKGDTGDTGPAGVVSATAPVTYDSGTQTVSIDTSGFLLKAGNLSGLADASAARTNLGLGTMATATATDYLSKAGNLSGLADLPTARTNLGLGVDDTVGFGSIFKGTVAGLQYSIFPNDIWAGSYDGVSVTKTSISSSGVTFPDATVQATKGLLPANNLSDLASASTARTNLGLGTMATETASDYLTKAGNLSGLASAATARTNLDVYSKSESDALVPSASTTVAGKVELATDAEAAAGTSSTLAVTPLGLRAMVTYPGLTAITTYSLTAATSGAGASSGRYSTSNAWVVRGPTTAVGYAVGKAGLANSRRGGEFTSRLDWSKPCAITARCTLNPNGTIDANSIFRMSVGKSTTANEGDISSGDAVQIKVAGGGAIQLLVCSASTVTTVTSSFSPVNDESFDVVIHSDGSGNVTLYVNGSSVATTTGGPTSTTTAGANYCWHIEVENINTLTDSFAAYCVNNAYIHSEG